MSGRPRRIPQLRPKLRLQYQLVTFDNNFFDPRNGKASATYDACIVKLETAQSLLRLTYWVW